MSLFRSFLILVSLAMAASVFADAQSAGLVSFINYRCTDTSHQIPGVTYHIQDLFKRIGTLRIHHNIIGTDTAHKLVECQVASRQAQQSQQHIEIRSKSKLRHQKQQQQQTHTQTQAQAQAQTQRHQKQQQQQTQTIPTTDGIHQFLECKEILMSPKKDNRLAEVLEDFRRNLEDKYHCTVYYTNTQVDELNIRPFEE